MGVPVPDVGMGPRGVRAAVHSGVAQLRLHREVKVPTIEIDDIASIGAVRDTPSYQLPPEAWTVALNMRAVDGGMERGGAWESIFGAPGVAPHFVMSVATAALNLWLYTSLTKAFGYDGTSHTDITRLAGDYTAANTADWNGTLFAGIPIVNNFADVPQMWSPPALATRLIALTNWPAPLRAKVIRSFGPYLVAINLSDGGALFPHTIQWSHPAVPGAVPSSWDYTDPTVDAGRRDFPDVEAGVLVDALPLGSIMYIYKESSTWRMRHVGGRFIFDFGNSAWLTNVGLLAPRCVATTGDGLRHVLATQDDIIWHNGNTVRSILNKRQKRRLFNEIDTENFKNSFMFANPTHNEMWFCYPSSGQTHPDKALLLSYGEGEQWVVTEMDGITFRNAASGAVETTSDELWSDGTDTWGDDTGPWSTLQRRRTILAGTAATKFYNLDKGITRDGLAFTGTLNREGLAVIGRKRNGDWVVDFETMKLLKGIWPKVKNGPVNIRFGAQQVVDGGIQWGSGVLHDPAARSNGFPHPVSGRAVGVEYSAAVPWRLDGHKLDIDPMGKF